MTSLSPIRRTDRLVVAVRDLASARRMQDIVEVVRHAARELVSADGATFVLREAEHCHYVDEDAIAPLWRGQRFPLSACISGWSMLHRQSVAIPDIYLDDRIPHDAYRPTFVRSLVMTPVRAADPIAAIGTYWADKHWASEEELELLQALADTTAVAIESVRVVDELEDRVRRRTEELAAANRDARAFAHLVAHDLRTPLFTASGYISLAIDIDGEHLSDDGRDALDQAQHATKHMSELIDAILEYSSASHSDMQREPVDLNAVAARARDNLGALIAEHDAQVRIEELPQVHASAPLIERAVQNLIANAINYGDRTRPVVTVSGALDDSGAASICVSDNGPGVPEADRGRIFEMFTRGSTAVGRHGHGIGLAFVARVMQKHGGTVRVDDSPAGGATFELTLPPA